MPKNTILILGVVVALLPFLGIPNSFKAPVYFLLGLGVAYISFDEHRQKKKMSSVRRVYRKKNVVTLKVGNGVGAVTNEKPNPVTNLVESNEKNKKL